MGKHVQSIDSKLLSRVYGQGRGWVFTPNHFQGIGSRDAIASALKRHKKAGTIRQLARGLYDYPRQHASLGLLNSRFKDYFDLHYLAQNFTFEGVLLAKAIAGTFERRGTLLPRGLPVGLTPTFAKDPAKIRGWTSFWGKTVQKTPPPPLEGVVQFLVEFLEPPLDAAAKGQALHARWQSDRWLAT